MSTVKMDPKDDLSELAEVLQAHVDAVNSGDVEALLEHFAEDVVYLAPGLDPILGKAKLEALLRPFYAANHLKVTMTAEDRVVEGDLAWEWGVGTGEVWGKDGGAPTSLSSKYFFLYRRGVDGIWRLIYDMTNDTPEDKTGGSVG